MPRDDDFEAQGQLVERVVRRLRRELDLSCDPDDLTAWGQQGLLEARQRFDPSRGVRFSAFAYYRIRGAVLDGVRKQGWMPRRSYAKLKALEAADAVAEQYSASVGAAPAAATATRASDLDAMLGQISAAFVLSTTATEENDPHSPERRLDTAQRRAQVRRSVAHLPPKERDLVQAVYFEGATIEEGGARLGLSKSWASRLHAKALERMKKELMADLE